MGEILLFEPERFGRREVSQDQGLQSTAEIIIFPGVRYERLGEVTSLPCAKTKARTWKRPKLRPSRR